MPQNSLTLDSHEKSNPVDWDGRSLMTCLVDIAFIILLHLFFIQCTNCQAAVSSAGGTGEPNDPYQIVTAEQLIGLSVDSNLYDKHFILIADIDLDPNLPGRRVFDRAVIAPDEENDNWIFKGTEFNGSFNGQGHSICHLSIQGASYMGLFGRCASTARISNLGLEMVDINSTGDFVGALVGWNDGQIMSSYSTTSVSGNDCVGGLVGCNNDGRISTCYSTGYISGNNYVGGISGFGGKISACYSTGSVNGSNDVSGLVGYGYVETVSAYFWDIDTPGMTTSEGGIGLTTAEMHNANTYLDAGWDFSDIWMICEGRDYPRLQWGQVQCE